MTINLTNPMFHDDDKARAYFEAQRWPNGPFCPHCGEAKRVSPIDGKSHRPGLFVCFGCRGHFTVMVGTVMERSHIPLSKWAAAFHLMSASKKGISAHQLHRMLGLSYKSAWFMCHRIREAMKATPAFKLAHSGGDVEADESYLGGTLSNKHSRQRALKLAPEKTPVMTLVERGGEARSFRLPLVSGKTLAAVLWKQVSRDASLFTDNNFGYRSAGREYARHETVSHANEEWRRGDAHTNTVEGYFSILKRGIYGVYHHVSQAHLDRYLAEFDFRYSNRQGRGIDDTMRAAKAIKGVWGKRLTYKKSTGGQGRGPRDTAAPKA